MKKKSLLPLGLAIGLAFLAASPLIQASTYTQTKYPIVLAHGMLGFDNPPGQRRDARRSGCLPSR